jgi:MerR family copper efflux transcriptional regulator
MRIGRAARLTGLTVKAIRHYEALGLLGELPRVGRYRDLSPADVERLRLIAHCRSLGFGLCEIEEILTLVEDARPDCPAPRAMLDLVQRRLRTVADERARLTQLSDRLERTAAYLEERAARSA